jgi:Flp pilus assembly pilin Flp
MNHIRRHISQSHGQTMTEYALILALLVLGTLAVLPILGGHVLDLWNSISAAVGP